ncbi:MAG: apolipoprotein N-acyltransferase [Verrucomicrobiales bacterium]|nr:apolipoprotein N-acyltransferase [Verrucomicrobiales bacterium]
MFSGIILSLCYPQFNLGELIWISLIPLISAIWLGSSNTTFKKRTLRGASLGYIAGLIFFLINLSWLHHIHLAACTLLPAFLALYFAIWGAFAATIGRPSFVDSRESDNSLNSKKLFSSPSIESLRCAFLNGSAWCGLEWLRGWFLTGFPWNGLGVGLKNDLVMIQIVDLIGVTGLSFVIVFCSSICTSLILRITREIKTSKLRAHPDFAVGIIFIASVFIYGTNRLNKEKENHIEVSVLLVQGGINQIEKWDANAAQKIYKRYWDLTAPYLNLENANFDLVVWPESSLPYSLHDKETQTYLNKILSIDDFELVLGLNENIPQEGIYNSIVVLRKNTSTAKTYRKIHLVPFGEYVPLRSALPFLEKLASNAIGVDFTPGKKTNPIKMTLPEPYSVIPLVCFEDTFGNLARKFIKNEPQLIVNVTNDGWFGKSAASEQHLANAMFRCIELRRPMIRSANTGISCIIDSTGNLHDRWASTPGGKRIIYGDTEKNTFVTDSLPELIRIPKNPKQTLYARIGDSFSILLGAISLIAVIAPICRKIFGFRT